MLPLETKQSGGKLLPHSDLRRESVSRGSITQKTKRDEVTGNGKNYMMRSLMICTPYPIVCGW
jgi:hypothetical protein